MLFFVYVRNDENVRSKAQYFIIIFQRKKRMIEALLKRLLFRAVMDKAEQEDKEFIEGYDEG